MGPTGGPGLQRGERGDARVGDAGQRVGLWACWRSRWLGCAGKRDGVGVGCAVGAGPLVGKRSRPGWVVFGIGLGCHLGFGLAGLGLVF
jgi:hypothetical protein